MLVEAIRYWLATHGRQADAPNLFLQEFEDFFEELLAVLLEKNKMRGVLDQNIALHRSVYELTHQTFAVLLKRPSIVIAADHQGGRVYIGSVPQGPARRLIKRIFQYPIWGSQAWRRSDSARRVGRQTLVPECCRLRWIAILVLVFDRNFAVPARRIGRFGGHAICT